MNSTDRRPSSVGILVPAAVVLTLGHAAFLFLQPFNRRISAFLIVYTVLCAAIGALALFVRRRTIDERTFRFDAALILAGALFMRVMLLFTAPTLSDDVYRYLWDGRVQNAGMNPYLHPPAAPEIAYLRDETFPFINHPTVRTIYPPLAELTFRAAAAIRPRVEFQKVFSAVFDLALVGVLLGLLRARKKPAAWAALYAWHPLAVVESAGSGHVDSLMMLLLFGGCLLFERRKPGAGAGAFGLAAMAKWIPFVMAPWLIVRARLRDSAVFLAAALVLCIPFVMGLLVAVQALAPDATGATGPARDWVFNAGLYSWLAPVLPEPVHRRFVLGGALILFAFWWARRNEDPVRYAFGALFALLLASPVVHPWYVLWLLPFAVLLGSFAAFLWAWSAALVYVVQIRYAADGVWILPAWVPAVEYALLYGALVVSFIRQVPQPRAETRRMPPIPDPRVGIVIPVLNEEHAIGLVIAAIPRERVNEIIVVDNGSTDKTVEIARMAGARVLHEGKKGYGSAVQRGLLALSPESDVAVVIDGDRSDFPEELPHLLRPIQLGEADLVIGSRVQAALPGSLMPQQRFGNWLTCVLIRALYGFRYTDMGPFRAIRRTALTEMRMTDETWGWNVEMQVKALRLGFRVAEVPVRYRPRIGQSKISGTITGSVRAGVVILWSIYKYGFSRR